MSAPIWFDSTETGAPVLNNAAGSLISLLRAVLINGFNVKAITGIVVASGVATVTCPAHGYSSAYGKWLQITGANAPLLNGVKQQTIVNLNTFTFPAPGVADGSYTATDARRAPLGWQEEFVNGGNTVAIFRRTAIEATAMRYRVNDSGASGATATDARVLMLESATGVDTYTAPSPTEAQVSGGLFIHKGPNNATPKRWVVVGDDRGLWLFTQFDSAGTRLAPMFMGDGVSYSPSDAFFALLMASGTAGGGASSSSRAGFSVGVTTNPTVPACVAARPRNGIGTSSITALSTPTQNTAIGPTGVGQNSTDNVVVHKPAWLIESDGQLTLRGEAPGLWEPLARTTFPDMTVVPDVGGTGRNLLAVWHNSTSTPGVMMMDLTGPWY